MPKKIPHREFARTPENLARVAAIAARADQPRPRRFGEFDLDLYAEDLVAGRTDRPGIVRARVPDGSGTR